MPCFNRESGNSTAQGGLATGGTIEKEDWDGIWECLRSIGTLITLDVSDFFLDFSAKWNFGSDFSML